jgi:hypothetical protein
VGEGKGRDGTRGRKRKRTGRRRIIGSRKRKNINKKLFENIPVCMY